MAGDHAERHLTRRPLDGDLTLAASVRKARLWLEECDSCHGRACSSVYPAALPTRLLDVGERGSTPCLILSDTLRLSEGNYVALSYCWGGPQPVTLCRATLRAWTFGSPIEGLPKTIVDAIAVTRELGLRYLWVDSLCIVQDDPADMARELAKMGNVYEQAYVTISAAGASSSEVGFLHPTRMPRTQKLAFKIPFTCAQDSGWLHFIPKHDETYDSDPILQRAWTFQEETLSPRVLTFGTYQLRWSCPRVSRWRFSDLYGGDMLHIAGKSIEPGEYDSWPGKMKQYSSRSLSVSADKLVAVAAIAELVGLPGDHAYLAGLWDGPELVHQLAWYVPTSCDLKPRPSQYRAPSWSWASVDDGVKWLHLDDPPPFEVLEYQTSPTHQGLPYGAVTDGYLKIRSRIAPMCWERRSGNLRLEDPQRTKFSGAQADAGDDFDESPASLEVAVWGLELTPGGEESDWDGVVALLLCEVGTTFKRVGIFSGGDLYESETPPWREWRNYFNQQALRTITVV